MNLREAQKRDRDPLVAAIRRKVEDHNLSFTRAACTLGLYKQKVIRTARKAGIKSQHESRNPQHRNTEL